ncbi:biotin/lipoyl-containing protein [Novosphingobium sp.]|uniref:biotin/lipoyl-containing protein n=1 Tax=Novosphingobium sp. TaxID=1874826 RepID=UPI0026204606|nr:biotin/lipoyl-containing protein [Novosphingobium sp.]
MIEMVLPQFGMGMADGTITIWHKAVGDAVRQGEPLCDVEAAKTTVEVGAPCDGVLLQIIVPSGTNVPVNTVIAVIGSVGAEPLPVPTERVRAAEPSNPAATPVPDPAKSAPPAPRPAPERPGRGPQIEPRARRAARERGLDLAVIQGSGPGGRITEEDVLRAVQPTAPIAALGSATPSAPHNAAPVFQVLRARCDGSSLTALLDAVAVAAGMRISLQTLLVKAAAGALCEAGLASLPVCRRDEDGALLSVSEPLEFSTSALEGRFGPAEIAGACLVIEPLVDGGMEEAARFDPACAASLSVSVLPAGELLLVLVVSEPAMPYADARCLLGALRKRLEQPLAILV